MPDVFLTSPNSPFPDRYDLYGEINAVRALYDSPSQDLADPLFARWQEVKRREKQFAGVSLARRKQRRAERAASLDPAKGLVNDATLLLHSVDAQQLLVGTLPRGSGAEMTNGVSGVLRACSSIALLYRLTGRQHPFADWALIDVETALVAIEEIADEKLKTTQLLLANRAESGLSIGLLHSEAPMNIPVRFGSPHGYRLCDTVIKFDLLVRHMRTLSRSGMLTSTAATGVIQSVRSPIRKLLEQAVLRGSLLMQPAYAAMTRADFSDPDMQLRIAKLERVFTPKGVPMPDDIRAGIRRPDFFLERT
jgi:hypothetical protein